MKKKIKNNESDGINIIMKNNMHKYNNYNNFNNSWQIKGKVVNVNEIRNTNNYNGNDIENKESGAENEYRVFTISISVSKPRFIIKVLYFLDSKNYKKSPILNLKRGDLIMASGYFSYTTNKYFKYSLICKRIFKIKNIYNKNSNNDASGGSCEDCGKQISFNDLKAGNGSCDESNDGESNGELVGD